ncbi:MAG: LSU ribosomal protein L35p, partial [uncultured Friedmanniella sp.]
VATEMERHHAEDEDALRCEEAVPYHRLGQGDAPQGGEDAPQRAQAEQPHPSARRRRAAGPGRRRQGQEDARQVRQV